MLAHSKGGAKSGRGKVSSLIKKRTTLRKNEYVEAHFYDFVISPTYTRLLDVNTSRTLEEGAHSPSWPNGLIIIIIIIL
jgi:hypothetical protein